MAAPRNGVGGEAKFRDEESLKIEDSSTNIKIFQRKFPLTKWELLLIVAMASFFVFVIGLFFIFLKMHAFDYGKVKFPRNIDDLRLLKDDLAMYANDYPSQFIIGYSSVFIFMQTFMIPGKIFMALLAGALFGVFKGLLLVVFNLTIGASCCFFLSKFIGKPIVNRLWPEKLKYFQGEIAKRRGNLMNYMLFLRVTPTLPNVFINLASPIVDIPFHIFFLATLVGLIPASFIIAKAGLTLGELKSVKDLYDYETLAVLFLIGFVVIFPAIVKRKLTFEGGRQAHS